MLTLKYDVWTNNLGQRIGNKVHSTIAKCVIYITNEFLWKLRRGLNLHLDSNYRLRNDKILFY